MLNLIYYYPLGLGAPSEVSRNIFSMLVNKNLPFKVLAFPQYSKGKKIIEGKYDNIRVMCYRDIFNLSNKTIIHFTIDPLVFPNRRFLLYLMSLLSHRKIIISYHGDPLTEFKIKLANRDLNCIFLLPNYMLSPFVLKSADLIIVNSEFMKNLFKIKYNIKNLAVIPNGIDSSWLNNINLKCDLKSKDPGTFSLFYHGRLAPEKGVDVLIESLYHLTKEYKKNIRLYIAGEGTQEKYLKELCIKLKIEKDVNFLGYVSPPLLKTYLHSVDAAIYPSIYEPFSLAVLEAFSTVNGPVIYSNNIGINDFVLKDGFNFYTFEPSVEGITDSIKMIIDKRYDERISDKQKEFASKYTWDKIINEYVIVYQKYL
ncbi:MAG: glycosyltransferase family 4 protein [Methanosarcina sp.]